MTTNKRTVIITIIIIIILIVVPTTYKVFKNHNDNLYKVVFAKITNSAKKCYLEDKCLEDKISLKTLYELKYLNEKVSDPISKEIYNENSYVKRDGLTFEFVIVEE